MQTNRRIFEYSAFTIVKPMPVDLEGVASDQCETNGFSRKRYGRSIAWTRALAQRCRQEHVEKAMVR